MAWVLFAQQNTIKTAFRFSRINFYFVTAFYSLYDICMARQIIKTTIETIETKNLVKTCFLRRQVNATTPLLHNDIIDFRCGVVALLYI